MPAKLTLEEMQRIAASRGGKCLSKTYVNSQTKLRWSCQKGHEWQASPTNIKSRNSWCPYCAGKLATTETSLATLHPKIATQWHPEKNGKVGPNDLTIGSSRKGVWWKCARGHEWQASVATRVNGHQCPYCTFRKVCDDNNLEALFPEIAVDWHPSKNSDLRPSEIVPGTKKKVWWNCKKGHEWETTVQLRTSRGTGCPVCAGHTPGQGFNLGEAVLDFVAEWHPEKNGELTPFDVTSGSSKKILWKCKYGHEWEAPPKSRTRGSGCPYCKSKSSRLEVRFLCELRGLFGEVIWLGKINGKECDLLIPSLNVAIEIDGYPWHLKSKKRDLEKSSLFESCGYRVYRVRDSRLPVLSGRDILYKDQEKHLKIIKRFLKKIISTTHLDGKLIKKLNAYLHLNQLKQGKEYRRILSYLPGPPPKKSLEALYPDLASEWNQTKNEPLTPKMFSHGSSKKVWWQCKKGHEWQMMIKNRAVAGYGCPYCSGKRVGTDNNFAYLYPKLLKEWHPTKNKEPDPSKLAGKSGKMVWWQCGKGHEWSTVLSSRTHSQSGCPHCSNRGGEILPEQSILATNPKLAEEWHPDKNGDFLPSMVSPGSNKKAWWVCEKGHEWDASVAERTAGHGCSYCAGKKVRYEDSLEAQFPVLADQWSTEKNGELKPGALLPGSGRKVWWRCAHLHEWKATIYDRTKHNRGCPYCAGQRATRENNLESRFPVVARDWHPKKNGNLRPTDVTPKSNRKVWWLCPDGHEFEATPKARTRSRNRED